MLAQTNSIFNQAYNEVQRISQDDEARMYYEYQMKREADRRGQINYAVRIEREKWQDILMEERKQSAEKDFLLSEKDLLLSEKDALIANLQAQLAAQSSQPSNVSSTTN